MTDTLDERRFAWRPFLRNLCAIAIPVAMQNLLTTTGSMVDTIMVKPLGEDTVGALGLCAQYSSLMFSCYWGFVGGGMLFMSQYYGAKDEKGVERSYGMTMFFLLSVALLFGAMAIFCPEMIMKLYTNKAGHQAIGVQYLHIVGYAYVFQVISMGMSILLRTTGHATIPLIASIVSVSTNIFLNWVLIGGHLGAPAFGIKGAAMATVAAGMMNVLVIIILSAAIRYRLLFRIRKHFAWSRASIRNYLHKCFPIICNELLVGIGFMIINITLGRQPEHIINAVSVFRIIEGLIIGFFAGFSNASSILVGTCVGEGQPRVAFERAKRLIYLCSGVIATVEIILFALRRPILTTMSLSGQSYAAGVNLLLIYFIAAVFRMGNWMQNDTYRVSGDTIFGTVLEISFQYAMVIPCMLLAAFYFHAPYWVVFLCCYIDEPIRYFLMQCHFYSAKWIKPVTDVGKKALEAFLKERKGEASAQ